MKNDCIFCDRAEFEDRIIYEDERHYLIATVGQILRTGGYVLLIPKVHTPCLGAMGDQDILFLSRLQDKIVSAITNEYGMSPIIFEHGIVGQSIKHAHIHIAAAYVPMTKRIKSNFRHCKIQSDQSLTTMAASYRKLKKPYLMWQDFGEVMPNVCWDPPAPPQYLRIVVAEALGTPERANWKNVDEIQDKESRDATVQRLKPYF